jgi:hypothetical protein
MKGDQMMAMGMPKAAVLGGPKKGIAKKAVKAVVKNVIVSLPLIGPARSGWLRLVLTDKRN